MGRFGEFVIAPTSEAIFVPASHTSRCVALDFFSTHRSQSLFVAVAGHEVRITTVPAGEFAT